MRKFALIGDGKIAEKHKKAIESLGGLIVNIYDPINKSPSTCKVLDSKTFFSDIIDYVVICSPSDLHREHTKLSLEYNKKVIVEKPMVMPWEPMVDDDRVNVVLQYRWLSLPFDKADLVEVIMVRDKEYFKSWKGNPSKTGGTFYNLFIHYIDLALKLNAKFNGKLINQGNQVRRVDDFDLFSVNMDDLYSRMYNDIVNHNKGVKPRDIFYLHWLLNRNSEIYGYGSETMDKNITLSCEI